jgi:hypothetical protein
MDVTACWFRSVTAWGTVAVTEIVIKVDGSRRTALSYRMRVLFR